MAVARLRRPDQGEQSRYEKRDREPWSTSLLEGDLLVAVLVSSWGISRC